MMETYNIIQYTNTHEMSSVQNPKCHLVTLLYGLFLQNGIPTVCTRRSNLAMG